jgi:hypothetical protein
VQGNYLEPLIGVQDFGHTGAPVDLYGLVGQSRVHQRLSELRVERSEPTSHRLRGNTLERRDVAAQAHRIQRRVGVAFRGAVELTQCGRFVAHRAPDAAGQHVRFEQESSIGREAGACLHDAGQRLVGLARMHQRLARMSRGKRILGKHGEHALDTGAQIFAPPRIQAPMSTPEWL